MSEDDFWKFIINTTLRERRSHGYDWAKDYEPRLLAAINGLETREQMLDELWVEITLMEKENQDRGL